VGADREALARQALSEHVAATAVYRDGTAVSKRKLRAEFSKAGFGHAAFNVGNYFIAITDEQTGRIPDKKQPTWETISAKCNQMAAGTVDRSLEHLERHEWVVRWKVGVRNFYQFQAGKPCRCRPGRGHPMSQAERKRESRAKQAAQRRDVTLTGADDVTLNGSDQLAVCHSGLCDKSQVKAAKPIVGADISLEPTEVRASALAKNGSVETPESAPFPEPALSDSCQAPEGGRSQGGGAERTTLTAAERRPHSGSGEGRQPQVAGWPQHPTSLRSEGFGEPSDLGWRRFCAWCGKPTPRCGCWNCFANDRNGCRVMTDEERAVRLVVKQLGGQVI
jgi:hypothetical protein